MKISNKKEEYHVFYLFNVHDLIITRSIINQYLKSRKFKIYFMGVKSNLHSNWLGDIYEKIYYMESTSFYSRIKLFKKIYNTIEKNKDKDIYFYASTYVNFVSNFFFRNNLKKILLSHGISNYVLPNQDFNSRTYVNTNIKIFDIFLVYYRHYETIFKQFIQLLIAGHFYDINYTHSSNYNKIKFTGGYFFSLKNLVTKTNHDKVVSIDLTNNDLPNEAYILYLEELHSPVKRNDVVKKMLINYINDYPEKILLHKPHPNMANAKLTKLKVKNKIIYADPTIPAEYYINKNVKVTVIGCLSSTLIYSKLINPKNEAIYFDDQPFNKAHGDVLRNFNVKINRIIANRTYYNDSEYFTYTTSFFRKAVRGLKDLITAKDQNYKNIKSHFYNKKGIEIGGPSRNFQYLFPIYRDVNSISNVNFSSHTFWEGEIVDGNNFRYFGNKVGIQYILEGNNLNKIKDNHFDFLISSHTLEHIANPIKALIEWKRIIIKGGCLFLILPNKKNNFDHTRKITEFDHLIYDYDNKTEEDDMTHLDEVLNKHDLSKDLPAGDFENFKARSIDNFNNRHLHHHVFSENLLIQIFEYIKLTVIFVSQDNNNLFIAGKKVN